MSVVLKVSTKAVLTVASKDAKRVVDSAWTTVASMAASRVAWKVEKMAAP